MDSLWNWFGLSYASWLTLPRVMMHEMPDEWQEKMAILLEEWDETWKTNNYIDKTIVSLRFKNKFIKTPNWLKNYRHPDKTFINSLKSYPAQHGANPKSATPSRSAIA